MNLHWILIVWGREFTDFFLKVVLPNQLSPLNLPNCCAQVNSVYKIYTTPRDGETIRNAPIYRKLTEVLRGKVEFIEDILDENVKIKEQESAEYAGSAAEQATSGKDLHRVHNNSRQHIYAAMTQCHKHAIASAEGVPDAAFIFLPPDVLFSDGSFTNMLRIARSGKRAIMIGGPHVVQDTITPAFLKKYYCESTQTATITARDLARHVLEHLHPFTKSFFWDAEEFTELPSVIYWSVPQQGILARYFHLHPIFLRPLDRRARPRTTIDHDYLVRACPNMEDIYVVEDSDDIFIVDLRKVGTTHSEASITKEPHPASPRRVGSFAHQYCDAHHRAYFKHKMRIHCEDISPVWKQFEDESDQIERSVLKWYRFYCYWYKAYSCIRPIEFLLTKSWWQRLSWSLREKLKLRTRFKNAFERISRPPAAPTRDEPVSVHGKK